MSREAMNALVGLIIGIVVICLVAGGCYIFPKYKVYKKELNGKASLKEAEWDRKIKIEEAKAHDQSAGFFAAAEITRANGVAKANAIIGESLKDNEGYLRYLWIQGLHDGSGETVYIATEAGLPIMEANRRK